MLQKVYFMVFERYIPELKNMIAFHFYINKWPQDSLWKSFKDIWRTLYNYLALGLLCKLSWLGTRNDDILPLWGSGRRGTKIMVVRPLEFFHNVRQHENKVIRKLFQLENNIQKLRAEPRQLKSQCKVYCTNVSTNNIVYLQLQSCLVIGSNICRR